MSSCLVLARTLQEQRGGGAQQRLEARQSLVGLLRGYRPRALGLTEDGRKNVTTLEIPQGVLLAASERGVTQALVPWLPMPFLPPPFFVRLFAPPPRAPGRRDLRA